MKVENLLDFGIVSQIQSGFISKRDVVYYCILNGALVRTTVCRFLIMTTASSTRRVVQYAALGLGLTVAYFLLRGSAWQGTETLHTVMESLATLLAFFVGVMALIRHYSKKDSFFLIVGVGFLGTGFLDGYHTVVTSAYFKPLMPSDLTALIPWSWIASRQFLSIMLVFSWVAWLREERYGVTGGFRERSVYIFTALFTVASFLFFAFAPLPDAYYPEYLFHRPEELAPALFFLIALVGYLRKGRWRESPFEHWLVMSLIVSFVSQALFMSFSGALFDFEFDAAHTLKKVSYLFVLTGLLLSMYVNFRRAETAVVDLKYADLVLRESQERLQAINENVPAGIIVVKIEDGQIVFSNSEAQHVLGTNVGQEFGQNWGEIFYRATDREDLLISFSAEGRVRSHELCIKRPDGQPAWVLTSLVGVPSEDPTLLMMSFIEITERKEAERKLKDSETRFRDFGASASDWYWEMDSQLRFSFFSKRFTDITGVEQEALLGKTRQDNGNPGVSDEEWQLHLNTLAAHEPFRNFIHPRVLSDGTTAWLSINGRPVFDADGAFSGYRGAGLEITEKVNTENDLRKAREEAEHASVVKSEFLAAMSHEIRTPMTGVMGFSDMLLDDSLSQESRDKVFKIKDATRSLMRIINDILDMSKMEAGKMEIENIDFHLPSLIKDALGLFEEKRTDQRAKRLTLEMDLDDDFPAGLHADPTRLRQILINLIGNAVKFTEQGSIFVKGSRIDPVGGVAFLRFEVVDTGIGLKPEAIGKLFTEFTQADASISRRYEGTGLGLSICKRLVELMGGVIGVESEYGIGSTFWFTLPFTSAFREVSPSSSVSRPLATSYKAVRPLHILIVDDNGLNQQIISATVKNLGHTEKIAENGMEAVEMHEKEKFDLILMDIRMPVMSGPDATRLIRQMDDDKADIKIIALTADAMEEHKAGYYEAGMDAVTTKPIVIAELARAINLVMDEEIHVPVTVQPATPVVEPQGEESGEDVADEEAGAAVAALMPQMGTFGNEDA
jgi:PAS domain S-box-containing protein